MCSQTPKSGEVGKEDTHQSNQGGGAFVQRRGSGRREMRRAQAEERSKSVRTACSVSKHSFVYPLVVQQLRDAKGILGPWPQNVPTRSLPHCGIRPVAPGLTLLPDWKTILFLHHFVYLAPPKPS